MNRKGSTRSAPLVLTPDDRALLDRWARSRTLAARVVLRSRIVLAVADGLPLSAAAQTLTTTVRTVRLWVGRYRRLGPCSLLTDAAGRGRKPALSAEQRSMLLTGDGDRTQVSTRALARTLGVSASTISRWRRRLETPS
jgi:transposase